MALPLLLEASRRHASALAFSPDGARLVTGGMEGTVRVWDPAKGKRLAEWPGHTKSVNAVSFAGRGRRVATAGSDERVILRDAATGAPQTTIPKFVGAWYSPGPGRLVLAKSRSQRIFAYDEAAGKVTGAASTGLKRIGWPVFLPDGRFAVVGYGPAVEIYDIGRLARVASLGGHATSVIGVAPLPGGRLATSDWKGTVRVWDVDEGRVEASFAADTKGYAFLAAHPTRDLLALSGDGGIGLWTFGGAAVGRLAVPLKGVYQVAFDPRGQWLANAASDGKVRLWRVRDVLARS